jgi:hypothetical protein
MMVLQFPGGGDDAVFDPYMMVFPAEADPYLGVLLKNGRMVIRLAGKLQALIGDPVLKPQRRLDQIPVASEMIEFRLVNGNQLHI